VHPLGLSGRCTAPARAPAVAYRSASRSIGRVLCSRYPDHGKRDADALWPGAEISVVLISSGQIVASCARNVPGHDCGLEFAAEVSDPLDAI